MVHMGIDPKNLLGKYFESLDVYTATLVFDREDGFAVG